MSTNDKRAPRGDGEDRPSYRERRARRADRLRAWADSRDAKATAANERTDRAGDDRQRRGVPARSRRRAAGKLRNLNITRYRKRLQALTGN